MRSSDEACVLSCTDKEAIMKGNELNDLHIDMAQNAIQIIHVQGNHWIKISTINCEEGEVGVYDSLYNSIDKNTHDFMNHLVPGLHITLKECQKQDSIIDCGLFSIAINTSLAFSLAKNS